MGVQGTWTAKLRHSDRVVNALAVGNAIAGKLWT